MFQQVKKKQRMMIKNGWYHPLGIEELQMPRKQMFDLVKIMQFQKDKNISKYKHKKKDK